MYGIYSNVITLCYVSTNGVHYNAYNGGIMVQRVIETTLLKRWFGNDVAALLVRYEVTTAYIYLTGETITGTQQTVTSAIDKLMISLTGERCTFFTQAYQGEQEAITTKRVTFQE